MSSKQKWKGMTIHLYYPVPGWRAGYSQITHSHPLETDVCNGRYDVIGPSLTIIDWAKFLPRASLENVAGASGHYPNRKPGPTRSPALMGIGPSTDLLLTFRVEEAAHRHIYSR